MPKRGQEVPGTKYGKLTIVEQSQQRIRNRITWTCLCECGRFVDVAGTDLRTGRKTHCGQCELHSNAIDETGNIYGRLTVIDIAQKQSQKSRNLRWRCLCECGEYTEVASNDLRQGKTTSCGCFSRECRGQQSLIDERGNKYGKLTVIDKVRTDGERTQWKCLCDCGNITYALGGTLRTGMKKSCGCLSSVGNATIESFLQEKNINYKKEFAFSNLVSSNGGTLRFDFAIYNDDNTLYCLLEYQGEQHFIDRGGNFGRLQREETDALKYNFCLDNNIKLYYITYIDNIEEKLKEILSKKEE